MHMDLHFCPVVLELVFTCAILQFAPISSWTDIFSSKFSWLKTGWKYFHCFSCPGLVMSSLLTGTWSLVNVVGKVTHRFLSSLTPKTCRPSSIAFDGLLNSPFILLMVTDVSLPGIQRWSRNWSNKKVP